MFDEFEFDESKLKINSRLYCPYCPPNKGDMYVKNPDDALRELDDIALNFYCKNCKGTYRIEMEPMEHRNPHRVVCDNCYGNVVKADTDPRGILEKSNLELEYLCLSGCGRVKGHSNK